MLVLIAQSHHCYQGLIDSLIISSAINILCLSFEFLAAVKQLLVPHLQVTNSTLVNLTLFMQCLQLGCGSIEEGDCLGVCPHVSFNLLYQSVIAFFQEEGLVGKI